MKHAVLRPASRRWRLAVPGAALAVLAVSLAGLAAPASATGRATSSAPAGLSPEFNRPGNILIADQFNNRVIEVDPAGHIVWQFGKGPRDFSRQSIIGTNDAQRVSICTNVDPCRRSRRLRVLNARPLNGIPGACRWVPRCRAVLPGG
jgi:hypothetical protein